MSLKSRKGTCRRCGHPWAYHDPSDGTCNHVADDATKGVCRCGRDVTMDQMDQMVKTHGFDKVLRIAQKRADEMIRKGATDMTFRDAMTWAYLMSVLDQGNVRRYEQYLTDDDKVVLNALGTSDELARKITSGEWGRERKAGA